MLKPNPIQIKLHIFWANKEGGVKNSMGVGASLPRGTWTNAKKKRPPLLNHTRSHTCPQHEGWYLAGGPPGKVLYPYVDEDKDLFTTNLAR